jgi:hypothetical protein
MCPRKIPAHCRAGRAHVKSPQALHGHKFIAVISRTHVMSRARRRDARGRASGFRRADEIRHSVRIGDAIDFEIEDIVPFGVETGQPVRFRGMFHPAGSDLTIAEAKRSRINAFGIEFEGKTGLSTSEFSWAA